MKAILDFRFPILDSREGNRIPVFNPKSKIQNPKSRPGVSILEVMFAILVATVGLLGAVAVFPAASAMARKGKLNDSAASAGRSATHDFDVRGMRKPGMWWGFSANNSFSTSTWDFYLPPMGQQVSPPQYTAIGSAAALNPSDLKPTPTGIRFPPGTAFCIDPKMIGFYAQNLPPASNAATHAQLSLFPAVNRATITLNPAVPGLDARSVDPRMFRISLFSGNSAIGMQLMQNLQADGIFTFEDDLSFLRPEDDRSKPAAQSFDLLGGTGGNAKRLSDGHLSWMATLVPKVGLVQKNVNPSDQPIRGFAQTSATLIMTAQPTDEYVLSIVVFNDRTFDPLQIDPYSERLVQGTVQGDGSTGGEILLQDNDPKMLKLRPNDWVLLSGVYTYRQPGGATVLSNVPAFQWYRVSDCDVEPEPSGMNPSQQIYATLIGQDWNMDVVNPRLPNVQSYFGTRSGTVQVTIVEGVVAVYEKTIRLEY